MICFWNVLSVHQEELLLVFYIEILQRWAVTLFCASEKEGKGWGMKGYWVAQVLSAHCVPRYGFASVNCSCQFKCHGCFVSLGLEMTKQRGRADAANLISLWFGTMIRSLCFKVFKVLLGWKTLPDKTWQMTLQVEPLSYIGVTMKSFAWMSVHIIKKDMVELNIDFWLNIDQ